MWQLRVDAMVDLDMQPRLLLLSRQDLLVRL